MQNERNYDDGELAKRRLRRLDIDPDRVQMGWVIDFCAQGLRKIIMGLGGKMDGYQMASGFGIAASSELMAILSVTRDLADLLEMAGRIIVAYDKDDRPVTTSDLEVAGAMTAYMRNTNRTAGQHAEYQPVLSTPVLRQFAIAVFRIADAIASDVRLPHHGKRLCR